MASTTRPGIPLAQAATTAGISKEAMRKRVLKGQARAEKRDGQWCVLDVGEDQPPTNPVGAPTNPPPTAPTETLVLELRARIADQADQISYLREALAREQSIVAHLSARVAELVPHVETPAQENNGAIGTVNRPPWWRRLFGLGTAT